MHKNNFDILRLFAASGVALGHTYGWLGVTFPWMLGEVLFTFQGVAIFFIISGFLITKSYLADPNFVPYLIKRACRVYPALWLQYIAGFVVMGLTGGFIVETLVDFKVIKWVFIAGIVGSPFWANVFTEFSPFQWTGLYKSYPFDVLWTIPVELSFYLLVPVFFSRPLIKLRLTLPLCILAMVFSAAFSYFYAGPLFRDFPSTTWAGALHSSFVPYLWLFLAGAIPAYCWDIVKPLFVGKALWWFLVFILAGVINYYFKGTATLPYRIPEPFSIPRCLILAGWVIAFAHSRINLTSWLHGIDISYGLYLFHLAFPLGLYYLGVKGGYIQIFESLLIALIASVISWFIIEKPGIESKKIIINNIQNKFNKNIKFKYLSFLILIILVVPLIIIGSKYYANPIKNDLDYKNVKFANSIKISEWLPEDNNVKIIPLETGIQVYGNIANFGYQIGSLPIEVGQNTLSKVEIDFELEQGEACIGALSEDRGSWIALNSTPNRTLFFNTGKNTRIFILISNCRKNDSPIAPTEFILKSATISFSDDENYFQSSFKKLKTIILYFL